MISESLFIIGQQYLQCFQLAFTDETYEARVSPNPRVKIATGRTLESLQVDTRLEGVSGARIQITADESYDRILEGQEPYSDFPDYEQGSDLAKWAKAVGYQGSLFLLAQGIYIRGIEPADITGRALQRSEEKRLPDQLGDLIAGNVEFEILKGFNR